MTRLFSDISSAIFDQLVPNSSLARKHLMLIKKNVQGFSLIELMVAVGIMGGMTTLAVPQYGKYKLKAAQTEVKATLANIHGAQELHLVDKNYYAKDLAGVGLESLPTKKDDADSSGQNFVYGDKKATVNEAASGITGQFCTSDDGKACSAAKADGIEYRIVASAIRKLASCAKLKGGTTSEVWCLNDEKLMTNEDNNKDKFSTSGKRCEEQSVDTSASC